MVSGVEVESSVGIFNVLSDDSTPANNAFENLWSMAVPYRHACVPFSPSKNWLKPATCVGSRVWSVMSVRFNVLDTETRAVVLGNTFQVMPNLGLNWLILSSASASFLRLR